METGGVVSSVRIYHNPRCSKSRQTLQLLREHGIDPELCHYLDTPPSVAELERLLTRLGMEPRQLLRRGEAEYRQLIGHDMSDEEVVAVMVANPRLIERPIVVKGERAVLGRPPENVLGLIGAPAGSQ